MSELIHRERPAAGEAAGLLVLHHGRGADEHDLLGIADVLDPEQRLHVVTPRAPLQLPGWPGHHWYVVPRVGYPDPDTFHAAYRKLSALHDGLWERTGIAPERTVFGGFSMGSVMSYALGLGPDRPAPAGILAFSGFVPTVDGWEPDLPRDDARVHRPRPPGPDHERRVRARRPASCSRAAGCRWSTTSPTPATTSTPSTCPRRSTGCARRFTSLPRVPFEPERRHARDTLHSDASRAGARSHFRAMGIDPDRLTGPIVGIASTWTGTMPCNLTHRELAAAVASGVERAGGVPLEFNTIAVSDNQSQGTPGMRASLVSRELIADSIELMDVAHDFDALVCIVGCDKTVPAALMALARLDKPALVIYSGPMRAGANGATILEVWEAVGAFHRGLIGRDELDELERTACPGPGTCAGNFTANTMGLAFEFLGIAPLGSGMVPADDLEQRRRAAAEHGALATRLAADGRAPSSTAARWATRWPASPPPAARPTACCTCSPSPAKRRSSSSSTSWSRSAPARR